MLCPQCPIVHKLQGQKFQLRKGEKMGMAISEDDNGTKQALMESLENIAEKLPEEVAAELNRIWWEIWMDAIDFCSKTMDTGALASSINVIEGGMVVSGGMGMSRIPRQPIGNWIFDRSIIAGDETVMNPLTGKSTALYAEWVHDGHIMRDGTFWEGNPFLQDALDAHEAELEEAVDKAMRELGLSKGEE